MPSKTPINKIQPDAAPAPAGVPSIPDMSEEMSKWRNQQKTAFKIKIAAFMDANAPQATKSKGAMDALKFRVINMLQIYKTKLDVVASVESDQLGNRANQLSKGIGLDYNITHQPWLDLAAFGMDFHTAVMSAIDGM